MKKLALLLGLIFLTTPLMAQEFTVDIAQPKIVKKQIAGLNIDNINKTARVRINIIDANGEIVSYTDVTFENIEAQVQTQKTGEVYVYNVSVNGDNQQIESAVELTEYEVSGVKYPVVFDSMKPVYSEVVIQEADAQYNKFMTALAINQTGLNNAVKAKLGL